jgi:DNA-binding LacI/PurR family transcriptional regulator
MSIALCVRDLTQYSSLDDGQARALVAALSSELSFIQGPPGTGKSYTDVQIVRSIVKSVRQEDVGPILAICYTNHALDQFLNHLLDNGIKGVVRIGKRSADERIMKCQLDNISINDSRAIKDGIRNLHKKKDEIDEQFRVSSIGRICK